MTTEAFMKRGLERQELLKSLMWDLLAEEERREDPTFLFGVGKVLWEYLQQRRRNSPRHESLGVAEEVSFCADVALEKIRAFGRSKVEDDDLVAELFRKVAESATLHFFTELQREEFFNPTLIFHAPSAMVKVSIKKGP